MLERNSPWLFIAGSALIVGLAWPAIASADPIQITSGSLIWKGGTSADITANSTTGPLAIQVHGYEAAGIFEPAARCDGLPECSAGATVLLTAEWSGLDLPGEATYQGVSYPLSHDMDDPSVLMHWTGVLTLPANFTGGTLTAPFSFSGTLFGIPAFGSPNIGLTGLGTASLTLDPSTAFPGAFTLTAARYDFEPTPEPASLILLGTGIAGTWATRRRPNV